MTVTVEIDESQVAESLNAKFAEVKIAAQDAMADRMYEIVDGNLGDSGNFRPKEWSQLINKRYAKKVGREHATLRETGRMGATVDMVRGNSEFASVFTNDEVAAAHQYGLGKLKDVPRPFFPIRDGNVTPEATAECVEACKAAINEILQ